MCDYSLELYKSVPAAEGETLVVRRFPSGSKGLVSAAGDIRLAADCATCVKPGTLISFDMPDGTCKFGIFSRLPEATYAYKDGVSWCDGAGRTSLQQLDIGTKATVLSLPTSVMPEDADLVSPAEGVDPVVAINELIG